MALFAARPSILLSLHSAHVHPLDPHPSASIRIRHLIRVHLLLPPVLRRVPEHSPLPSFCSRPSTRSASIRIHPHPSSHPRPSAASSRFWRRFHPRPSSISTRSASIRIHPHPSASIRIHPHQSFHPRASA